METPEIEPFVKIAGSGFQDNHLTNTRTQSYDPTTNEMHVVSLTEWCQKNFITKRTGRKLIEFKYLIGFRRHRVWWITENPECLDELLDYLGVDALLFQNRS